jgi:hypothetical protein
MFFVFNAIFNNISVIFYGKKNTENLWKRASYINNIYWLQYRVNKGNNKITELGTILQRESQNS